ncbi:hypothetical protein PROFUN_14453 [Planoprotostelium fungivorum]|uniref:Uncharacterized protein n=1 Tax=Planoprotostelium fungivorum TaxID=1890364 RepID=A0A2P6MX93_9EUKA|nr:hypothetical protein PROFUN_14453 [Planoprotostelium fungivorum]
MEAHARVSRIELKALTRSTQMCDGSENARVGVGRRGAQLGLVLCLCQFFVQEKDKHLNRSLSQTPGRSYLSFFRRHHHCVVAVLSGAFVVKTIFFLCSSFRTTDEWVSVELSLFLIGSRADGLYSDTHRVTYMKEERVIQQSFFIARRLTTHQSASEEECQRRRAPAKKSATVDVDANGDEDTDANDSSFKEKAKPEETSDSDEDSPLPIEKTSDPRLTVLTWNMDEGHQTAHENYLSPHLAHWKLALCIFDHQVFSKEKVIKAERPPVCLSYKHYIARNGLAHPAREFSPRPVPLMAEPLRLASSFGANHTLWPMIATTGQPGNIFILGGNWNVTLSPNLDRPPQRRREKKKRTKKTTHSKLAPPCVLKENQRGINLSATTLSLKSLGRSILKNYNSLPRHVVRRVQERERRPHVGVSLPLQFSNADFVEEDLSLD